MVWLVRMWQQVTVICMIRYIRRVMVIPLVIIQNSQMVIKKGDLGTPNATWEKAKKFDIGLDMNFLDKFSFTIDYFLDKRYDQLVTRNDVPLVLGIGFSPNNIAKTTNQGFDGQISYQDRFGDFDFNTNLVFLCKE